MRRSSLLLYVKRMDNKTMRFEFTMKPLNSHSVSSHRDLSKDMFSSSSEVSSIENNFIIFQTIFIFSASILAFCFGKIEVINMIHAIIHRVLRSNFPKRLVILFPEHFSERLVGLIFKESIASAHRGFNHDVSNSDIRVTRTDTSVLISNFPFGHFNRLRPILNFRSKCFNAICLQNVDEVL